VGVAAIRFFDEMPQFGEIRNIGLIFKVCSFALVKDDA
jgi:hypothetical protein